MEKFKGKYRISSHRYHNSDYTEEGSYFITFNTKNHICYFGMVKKLEMELNKNGHILNQLIVEIPDRFPFIELDTFVIMPNHIHLLLTIYQSNSELVVEMNNKVKFMDKKSIPRIIRWLKGRFSFEIRNSFPSFSWQTNYHDHIIRNKKSYEIIKNYIDNNPALWEKDKFFNLTIEKTDK